VTDGRPLKDTAYMRFEDVPNPRKKTRLIIVYSKSQGFDLGKIRWHSRWRQYVFEPALGTLFNLGCLNSLADRLAYLNVMRRTLRRSGKEIA
jgi:hypothetical protein